MSRRPAERGTEVTHHEDGTYSVAPDNPRPSLEVNRTSTEIPRIYAEMRDKNQRKINKKKKKKKKQKKKKVDLAELKRKVELEEHTWSLEKLAENFPETDINPVEPIESKGLSNTEAETRLENNGLNQLTPPKTTPGWIKFLKHFFGFFSLLLLVGGILCFISFFIDLGRNDGDFAAAPKDNFYLGIVLVLVVFLTACFSHYQESKSESAMEGFKKLAPTVTKVKRDGSLKEINATKLVVGDIVYVKGGDKIPADIRIIASNGLKVDNSSLTGESEAQQRTVEMSHENPLETSNLAFYGTLALDGDAYGVIIRTGDNTTIGRIAALAVNTKDKPTPLHDEINNFVYLISAIAISLGVIFLIIAFIIYPEDWVTNIIFAIGIIVANVPEGLLATVTVALSLTADRMSKKHVLVKNLQSVETLGSTSTICSDKTGTLTQNRMTVAHVWYDTNIFTCDTGNGKSTFSQDHPTFNALQRIATLCNRATFDTTDPSNLLKPVWHRKTIGDASESALIKFTEPLRSIDEQRQSNPKKFEIPFNSTNKWQLSVHELEDPDDDRKLLVMKGAPERVFKLCNKMMVEGQEIDLDENCANKFQEAYLTLGSYGERVLGFAHKYLPSDTDISELEHTLPHQDMTFVGLTAMIDPPRPNVPEAVQKCKTAGIKVVMVTGDHPITAEAIARQVGIIEGDTVSDIAERESIPKDQVDPSRAVAEVVHGSEIDDLKPDDWDRILAKKQIVFARTSPQQKLIIVEQCQKQGDIVAVTGDGVNDSPALKKANIGVAMGIGGSDVSKDAADMILMDDNFASIVNGVEEGRLIFDNLKKSISYTLSSNIPELAPFLSLIVLGFPLPLSTVLILCIDLGTDMVPAISLAYEEPESDIMQIPPRNAKTDRLVTRRLMSFSYLQIGIIQAVAGFFTYFTVMGDYGLTPDKLVGLGIRSFLTNPSDSEPVTTITGQVLNGEQQKEILAQAQTAYLATIVIVQWADILVCKTRRLSLFSQGLQNNVLNFGIFFETALIATFLYMPGMDSVLGTRPIPLKYWLPALPFAVYILIYDELRKYLMRLRPNGWLERHTLW